VLHAPVLLAEVLDLLDPKPGEVYADGTAGLGGHASAAAVRIAPGGVVVLHDLDPGNLRESEAAVRTAAHGVRAPGAPVRTVAEHASYDGLPTTLAREGLRASALLLDLGFASNQVDDPARGLSFKTDGPLDMRLDPTQPVTAADLVNELDEKDLADLIYKFGEERGSRRIARKIVAARAAEPIQSTGRLAELVRSALPHKGSRPRAPRGPRIDPATRTFQALRIAVNDEIGRLERFLALVEGEAREIAEGRGSWLASGARVAVISFHSLEDRPVKQAFRGLSDAGLAVALTRKPIVASDVERGENPRARSAKLRGVRLPGSEEGLLPTAMDG
jgi:16S rRNA (cytosine1402-N4)-methyltransferase